MEKNTRMYKIKMMIAFCKKQKALASGKEINFRRRAALPFFYLSAIITSGT
jgi:hypothetical protein